MLSAVILTKNEENNIKDCIYSLKWCDEIIVVDDNSIDKTREIAKSNGAKVFIHGLNNDFSAQRNFALDKVTNDWILFVDADERVSEALAFEISNVINLVNLDNSGYCIRRLDFIWGKELRYGEVGNIKFLRLARKEAGKWIENVHEEWRVKGKIGKLKNPILHYPHQSIADFLREINFYTDIRSKQLFEQGKNCAAISIILYPVGKFAVNYFLKLGILDGTAGLLIAILMSFHSFLVRGKLWFLLQENKLK